MPRSSQAHVYPITRISRYSDCVFAERLRALQAERETPR
jgi:hypothetical protein